MENEQPSSLQMPAVLHGIYSAVHRKARAEGRRCGEQYRKDGSLPAPRDLLEVHPGEVVVVHEVADFQRAHPAWRLYMLGGLLDGLCEALDWKNARQVSDLYEEVGRQTAWGALYFAVSHEAPMSAVRMAVRLQAVLTFWEPLRSAHYLFKTLKTVLTLDELMMAACDWAVDAWCPAREASVRQRLEMAAARMARASREDVTQAILKQMPHAIAHARSLKHRELLVDPEFIRQRLATLEPAAFERVSGAFTAHLIELLYDWDQQLGMH